jgi:hyperosmotically inducible periplasmic protein
MIREALAAASRHDVLPTEAGRLSLRYGVEPSRVGGTAVRSPGAASSNGTETRQPAMGTANWLRGSLLALTLITSLASCAMLTGRETVGEYVDDTTITTKVKAAMFDDPAVRGMEISVETMQNVVQLSGFVDSAQTRDRAGELARNVSGVREVRNDLVVR